VDKVLPILCFCICIQLNAQTPTHKTHRINDNYKGRAIELGPLQIAEQRSSVKDKNRDAYQFAERRDVDLTPFNSGEWKQDKEYSEWTLPIQSKNATSLNLGFTEYQLPKDATLSIIDDNGKIIGPFSRADNKDHSQLWTPIVHGDKLIIRLRIPTEKLSEVTLRLSAINHGYRVAETRSVSGSCNIDVLCQNDESFTLIQKYQDQIQSVGVIQVNGSLMCSGFLINNTNNDFTPYFLTAAHCGINERSVASCVVYWNYENSFCRQPNSIESGEAGDGTFTQFNTGAELVSTAIDPEINILSVDFTLIKLNDKVDPSLSPYFAGWDINPSFSDTTFVVHHPKAEEKRISFDFETPRFAPIMEDSFLVDNMFIEDNIFVRVLNWELGTTEFGSSGAPLFNSSGKAIGALSGGQASCSRTDGFDDFGWLGLAWENEDSPETRLRDWLDPNNTGIQSLEGLNGSFTIVADESFRRLCGFQSDSMAIDITVDRNFKSAVDMSVVNLPPNISGSFSNSAPAPGETTTLLLSNLATLNTGLYQIDISGTDGVNQNSNSVTLDVIANVPQKLTTIFPKTGESVDILASFSWSDDAELYEIEIAEDISFVNPIISESSLNVNSFSTLALPSNSEFYWRVRASNFCGNSSWTDAMLFQTSNLDCERANEMALNIEISEDRDDTIRATINIDKTETIESVSVPLIEGEHTWSSDLTFNLISPQGTKVNLGSNICSGNVPFFDFKIGFNDQGFSPADIPCPFTDGRTYKPEEALETFRGENPQGVWTLEIVDGFLLDAGALQNWALQICSEESSSLFTQFSEQTIDACGELSVNSSLEISPDFNGPVTISTIPGRAVLDVVLSKTTANPGEALSFTVNNISELNDETTSIRFVATDGTQTSETILVLDFESSIEDFSLVNPVNGTIIRTGSIIDFDWEDASGITEYSLQISTDPTFIDIEQAIPANESETEIALDFVEQGEIVEVYWRVIAEGSECDKISKPFSFIADFTDAILQIENTDINIFPNPAIDQVFIQSNGSINESIYAELLDISGKRLQKINIPQGNVNESVNISEYPQGIYFLRLTSGVESQITKIVKQY